ncbi:MAG TPA: hypothetical protein VGB42_10740 [Candidatus Thermoplasmatota archaeon]
MARRQARGGLRAPLRTDRRAVSGVVAAALGVVLISILLTMVVTFWVPAWGYDNEVEHARDVLGAFGDFKSSVEIRAVQGSTNQTVTSSVPLGVGAVPLFGAETQGQLSYRYLEGDTPRFEARITDSGGSVNLSAAGALRYEIVNRYYDPQTYSYESGAVVLDQREGAAVRLPPAFSISNTTGGVLVSLTLVTLEGEARTLTGVEPRTITSRVTVAHAQEFAWPAGTVLSFEVWTWYPSAWARYFNDTAASAGLPEGASEVTTTGLEAPWRVALILEGVSQLAVTSALVQVQLD